MQHVLQAVWLDDPMEISFDGCYFLGNPGGAAGGAPPYDEKCPGGSEEACYSATCCSQPRAVHDPADCMECNGAFITLAATRAGVKASKGEVFGFSLTNSYFDWGPPWYANASHGRRAIAINETQGRFDRGRIVNSRVEHNTFTGVRGSATKLTLQLRQPASQLWTFDVCAAGILFPAAAGSSEQLVHHVDYSIQIEEAATFARHKLGNTKGCVVEVRTDVPVTATVFLTVDQSSTSMQYVPMTPA